MKMNNKGVSLIALAITIIVIIIIAAISYRLGFSTVDDAQRSSFMTEIEDLIRHLETYNTRAVAYNNIEGIYDETTLNWDGESERTTGSARMEKEGVEDTPKYILGDTLDSKLVKNKVKIIDGRLYVKRSYPDEFVWAAESVYKYMSGDGKNPAN